MLNTLQLLSNYLVLFPILLSIMLVIKKRRTNTTDIIGLILITSFLSDQISYIVGQLFGSNYWIINIYVAISIILIYLLFKSISRYKKIIGFSYFLVLAIFMYALFTGELNIFNGKFLAFFSFVNVVFCVLVFYEFFNRQEDIFIDKNPDFWFISGLLFYSAGSFFTFGFSSEILTNRQLQFSLLHISNIVNIILISIGLWRQMK